MIGNAHRFNGSLIDQKMKLFIYYPYGFPDIKTSLDIMSVLLESRVDGLEIGYPFSDPVADGPVIQKASTIALTHSLRLERCLEDVTQLRKQSPSTPIYLMTYSNPLWFRGLDVCAALTQKSGLDGWIIPDVPHKSAEPFRQALHSHNLAWVPLVSLNLPQRTLASICASADHFVYAISTLGVTGPRKGLDPNLNKFLQTLARISQHPVFVGFGIAQPYQAKQLLGKCQGIIVGSALIRIVLNHKTGWESHLRRFILSLRNAIE